MGENILDVVDSLNSKLSASDLLILKRSMYLLPLEFRTLPAVAIRSLLEKRICLP